VIVHIGATATRDALELARDAERAGADAIASLPPFTARPTPGEVFEYNRRLAAATALPYFVYYFPALTGNVDIDALCAIRGVAGLKFTDMNLYELGQIVEHAPAGFSVLNGHDQVLLPSLIMKAHGGVGSFYNIAAPQFVALYRAFRAGDLAAAQRHQSTINQLVRIVKRYRLVPALRVILELQGLSAGVARGPSIGLSDSERRMLKSDLEKAPAEAIPDCAWGHTSGTFQSAQ
jgi:N-acetylneuraminate lyase